MAYKCVKKMNYKTCTCTLILPLSAADFSPPELAVAKYWMTRLVFTVFPAPDSPLVRNKHIQRNEVSEYVYNEV